MSRKSAMSSEPQARKPWWRESEVAWLVLLVVGAYFSRVGVLPIRGEEPTRAQIAREMVLRGDGLVPREQGEPFRIRPPLQNWLIAASCLAFGSWQAWAVRFPSLLATLLTTLLIYSYSRTFLSRLGALAAGVAFATLAGMFQMGRQAETEALFILLVSASLLVWHAGFVRRGPDAWTFAAGYALMALAMLTKGLQAPTYFVGSVGLYLVLTGQGRRLFSRAHLLGVLAAAAVLGAWVLPYARVLGWSGVRDVWLGDPALHNQHWEGGTWLRHVLLYPLESAADTLPWSLLLLPYASRGFRRSLREARPPVLFLATCLAVAFPTCWLHPGGQTRFFAPLYPCLAVLIGLVVQRCGEASAAAPLLAAWRRYLAVAAGVMVAAAGTLAVAAVCRPHFPALAPWVEPPLAATAYAAAFVGLAVVVLRVREGGDCSRVRQAVLALGCFLALAFTGVATDIRLHRSEDVREAMKQLKERLPPGQQLVSLGEHADSLFAYHYGLPLIAPQSWLALLGDPDAKQAYFCIESPGDRRPLLPFAWEEIGAVSLDRNHHSPPERVMVVGRRLPLAFGVQHAQGPGAR
jgi:4-amino-4-deoxy-L-arabinose transferase-like glycosyltransferase